MNLTRLRYFVVTAEEESVVRAARRLHLAQPALSRQLAALEREVGTPLFERHARGVRLLPAGETLLSHARRVLAEADGALSATRNAGRRAPGARLRLGSPDGQQRSAWVGRAVEELRTMRPDVCVEHSALLWLEHERAVCAGELDVGFAIALSAGDFAEEIVADRLCDEPASVAVLPTTHPLARRESIVLADLRDVPLLPPPREVAPRLHDQTVALVRSAGFEPKLAPSSASFSVAVQLVIAGAGYIVAVNSVKDAMPPGVRAVPISDASIVLGFYMLHRRDERSDVIAAFRDALQRVVREEIGEA